MKRFLLFILLLILLGCTEKAPDGRDAVLTFHSFQGGGPGYTATIANSAVASVTVFEGAPSKKDSDGAYIMTVTCTGDFTIGDNHHRKKSFASELKKHDGDINFIMENVRDILMTDNLTIVNFEGTFTDTT